MEELLLLLGLRCQRSLEHCSLQTFVASFDHFADSKRLRTYFKLSVDASDQQVADFIHLCSTGLSYLRVVMKLNSIM